MEIGLAFSLLFFLITFTVLTVLDDQEIIRINKINGTKAWEEHCVRIEVNSDQDTLLIRDKY